METITAAVALGIWIFAGLVIHAEKPNNNFKWLTLLAAIMFTIKIMF